MSNKKNIGVCVCVCVLGGVANKQGAAVEGLLRST